jgi:hypothetical protein
MITYTGCQKLLNWFCGRSTSYSILYAGLSSTEPTVAGANVNEPKVNSYGRVQVAYNGSSKFGAPTNNISGSQVVNNAQIYFPETYNSASDTVEDWGELGWICLFDAASGGNLIAFDALPAKIHPGGNGESTIPIIRVGDAKITLGNADAQE